MKSIKLSLVLLICVAISVRSQNIRVHHDFPGGNVLVEKIRNDTIWLKPDIRDTRGEWFYWHFKIAGISGKNITFQFTQDNVLARFGPVYSINNPDHWKYLGEQSYEENRFSYHFGAEDTTAWFAMAIPYTQKNLDKFLNELRNGQNIRKNTLCVTRQGRAVEQLFLTPMQGEPAYRVLLTARHHACEMMTNYVMEGIIQSICNERNLQFLRDKVEFRIIPFMDKDGVENGDQGKNRLPRDHNRDYNSISVHVETATLRKEIPEWSDGKLKIALDLHCPWIRGTNNEWIYMVGSMDSVNQSKQMVLSKLIEKNITGEIQYRHGDFLPYGEAWNNSNNYTLGKSFGAWAVDLEGISIAGTLEFPYANVLGTPVTKDNAREFGRALAFSIQACLQQ